MQAHEVAERFWQAKPCRLGGRDRVVVEGSAVSYLLWGYEIARWHMDEDLLMVSDCGWQTWLTKDRLNNILAEVDYQIFGDRGRWFIHDRTACKSYLWEKCHKIQIGRHKIEPANPKVERKDVSERLKAYYEKAWNAVKLKNRTLVVRTLDGTAYIFVDHPYSLKIDVLVVKTRSPEFEAWHGRIHRSAIYAAFLRQNYAGILGKIGRELQKIDGPSKAEHVLFELRNMGFNLQSLPGELASSLALAKLLEC